MPHPSSDPFMTAKDSAALHWGVDFLYRRFDIGVMTS